MESQQDYYYPCKLGVLVQSLMLNVKQQQYPNETKEKNNMNEKKYNPTIKYNPTSTYSGSSGVPKSRSDFDNQSNVNKIYGWLKANWSKPIVKPGDPKPYSAEDGKK
jgi:hypothetical protein